MAGNLSKPVLPAKPWVQPLKSLVIGLAIGLAAVAVIYVPRAGWTSSDVTTGQHSGYPDLIPHRYDMPVVQATQVAAQVASRMKRWRVVGLDAPTGEVQAEVRAFPIPFMDDVTVTVRPSGPNDRYSEVSIRSRSRVGGADFGGNAQHIRALQAAMDDKLPRIQ